MRLSLVTRFLFAVCITLICITLICRTSYAQTPAISNDISQAMQNREYDKAIAGIDAALKSPTAPKDYLEYLKGRAYHYQGEFGKAIEQFRRVEKEYPQSVWLRRTRFAQAMSHARTGGFLAAEQIYRLEADYLLSTARKKEIADIYLEFAEGYFAPTDKLKEPDYTKALNFFTQALEVGPAADRKAAIQLKIAKCFQRLNNHGEAINRYQVLLQETASPLRLEAQFEIGQSYLAMNKFELARRN
ncbi:MAG: tetratricopeptide (TPR) repeat protein, partial [Pirellulaceae bacterium]